MKITKLAAVAAVSAYALLSGGAYAADKENVELAKCDSNLGTIAVVEGDTQGWSKYGLGSPRELIAALAAESGCFSPRNPADTSPATFLVNVIAGDQEEVDKGMELAKSAAIEGAVRSGAAGQVLSKVPFGGAMLGMFGGLGGKKKTMAAGIRVISPASGMTVASGSGVVKKSSLSFNNGGGWAQGANAAGYASSKDGKMLTEAFIIAFNAVVAQQATLASMPAAASETGLATVAVDTSLYAMPSADAAVSRALRAGTTLSPTGKREGLFIEAEDNFGTTGWVSVEDLK